MTLLASTYDQSRFLKAEDLAAEKKFRIKNVTEEIVGADKEKKLVVWFTNDSRGLVLNKTNNRTICKAFGDPVEGWTGKIIIVFPTLAEFRGTMKPALRVRIPTPKQPKPPEDPVAPQLSPSSGNGAAATQPAAVKPTEAAPPSQAALPVDDPDLAPDPVKSLSEEMDDDIPF